MVSTKIITIKGSQGVKAFVMISPITAPIGRFSIRNLMPYFQPPTWNPQSRFGNSRGGILTGSGGSPLHGTGRPQGGGNGPSGGGGGIPSGGRLLDGSGPPSGEGLPGGGGGRFLVGRGASVFFYAP